MTNILGFAGRKQSGKTSSCNFILALKLVQLGFSQNTRLDNEGNILVSDVLGQVPPELNGDSFFPFKEPTVKVKPLFDLELGNFIRIYSFADKLKEICISLFGLSYEQCYGTEEEKNSLTQLKWEDMPGVVTNKSLGTSLIEKGILHYHKKGYMTAREVLQFVGTEIFRKINPNCWVDAVMGQIEKETPEIALITDVRFPNELDAIRNRYGCICKLTKSISDDGHTSENYLDELDCDHIIENDDLTMEDKNSILYKEYKTFLGLPELV